MVHTKTSHHDRMEVFLEKYREPLPKPLEELERKALSEDVPIIRSGTRDMLRFLLRERKPNWNSGWIFRSLHARVFAGIFAYYDN